MPRASFACEVKMLSAQTPHFDREALMRRLRERAALNGHGQECATLTGPLQDSATLTEPLQEDAASTGHDEDEKPPTVLTDEIKAFIVRGLARYETPTVVAAAVMKVFGIEVSRQLVHTYNARSAQPPAERWCELFEATRESFLADISSIGIAQKAFRLRKLERFAEHAEERGWHDRAAGYMEQAAKECGGIYEGRKRVP
jgi:hypothetical protein